MTWASEAHDNESGPQPSHQLQALDELFQAAGRYRSTKEYHALLDFVSRFRMYAPFNAMLLHVQLPGAVFVAPPGRWRDKYEHTVKAGQRPLVILRPRGPVMFVFDLSQVEPLPGAPSLPDEVTQPFAATAHGEDVPFELTIQNAIRDGVRTVRSRHGSQGAGRIASVATGGHLEFQVARRPEPRFRKVSHRYDVEISDALDHPAAYATLVHELGHLYLGHIGTPDPDWWPTRQGLTNQEVEFEAESVAYLVCTRAGIATTSARYLSGYMEKHTEIPAISVDRVLRVAGLIEEMGKKWMPPRKESTK